MIFQLFLQCSDVIDESRETDSNKYQNAGDKVVDQRTHNCWKKQSAAKWPKVTSYLMADSGTGSGTKFLTKVHFISCQRPPHKLFEGTFRVFTPRLKDSVAEEVNSRWLLRQINCMGEVHQPHYSFRMALLPSPATLFRCDNSEYEEVFLGREWRQSSIPYIESEVQPQVGLSNGAFI